MLVHRTGSTSHALQKLSSPRSRPVLEIDAVTCCVAPMAPREKKSKPRTPQHWVPDLRDAEVLAGLRKQAKRMAQHPENGAIDAWIESVYDWEAWR